MDHYVSMTLQLIGFFALTYLVPRIVSYAVYQSRRDHLARLMKMNQSPPRTPLHKGEYDG